MAQFLVRTEDKINDDFYLNTKCTKRGDVIIVQPNDYISWGDQELSAPFWRIIIHTEITMDEAETMLAPEHDTDPDNPSKTLQRRAFKLELDAPLPPIVRAYVDDITRTVSSIDVTGQLTADEFRALKTQKPPITDPNP